jgi:hypothetical protein
VLLAAFLFFLLNFVRYKNSIREKLIHNFGLIYFLSFTYNLTLFSFKIQIKMKNSYFFKVWQTNKLLFGALILFVFGQLFFSYKEVETLPFFNYGMYSEPLQIQKSYTTVSIYQNKNQYVNLYNQKAPRFWQYQLSYYRYFINQNHHDPTLLTIQSRFGQTAFSNYLAQYLTNDKKAGLRFSEFLIQKTKIKNSKICQENYEWVKFNFGKVNSVIIN